MPNSAIKREASSQSPSSAVVAAHGLAMAAQQFGTSFLNDIALLSSYIPIAFYALGFRIQEGLVSVVCNKPAAPAAFTGGINDLRDVWSMKPSTLFGALKQEPQFQVVSLRHGNSFPLENKAILVAAKCIGKQELLQTDLSVPGPVSVNITFIVPRTDARNRISRKAGETARNWCASMLKHLSRASRDPYRRRTCSMSCIFHPLLSDPSAIRENRLCSHRCNQKRTSGSQPRMGSNRYPRGGSAL